MHTNTCIVGMKNEEAKEKSRFIKRKKGEQYLLKVWSIVLNQNQSV